MPERIYWIEDYSDEICPAGPTLESWAAWLSEAHPDWGLEKAATKGERFKANALRLEPDLIARRVDGAWAFDREPAADFFACRFAPGLGWNGGDIVDGLEELRAWFVENDSNCNDEEHVAVGHWEPDVIVIYAENPPRLLIAGTVQ